MALSLHLKLPARLEELHNIESALEQAGASEGWDQGLVYQIHLVLEELAVNTVNYGFGEGGDPAQGLIEILIEQQGDSLRIDYIDNGTPFNPFEEAPKPDLDASVAERRIGGLGVHFVRTMMDEVDYKREGGRNHISLIKQRSN